MANIRQEIVSYDPVNIHQDRLTGTAEQAGGDEMSAPFTVSKQPMSGDTVRLAVAGEVDLATSGALDEIIANVVTHDHPAGVIVDLRDVTFLDSTGISALLAGRNLAADHGVTLRIENPGGIVRRTLTATGLLDLLTGTD